MYITVKTAIQSKIKIHFLFPLACVLHSKTTWKNEGALSVFTPMLDFIQAYHFKLVYKV